ncbi:MAG: sensor domain-containing diguanylate cyclase [Solirubrobacteraceae bacterium]
MSRAVATVRSLGAVRPEERVAAGRVGAVVWIIASLSVIAMAVVLPAAGGHRSILIAMGIAGCVWGCFSGLLLDYSRLPVWTIHLSAAAGVVSIAVALALSGGTRSPAWPCLFYVVVFAAYFFKPQAATAYFAACVAVECVIVLTSADATRSEGLGRLVVAAPAFVVLGAAVVAGKRFMWNLRGEAETLAAEQGALRRIATAVVSGEPAERFYPMVCEEAAQLVSADGAGILRLEGPTEARVLGAWAPAGYGKYDVGELMPIPAGSQLAQSVDSARSLQVDLSSPGSGLDALGYRSSIIAPIRVAGRAWGFLAVVSASADELTPEQVRRLTAFSDLLATSVANIEDHATLAAQALSDPLTGVANRRAFHERLDADVARARRHNTPVAVAMIDVDHFKQVNDVGGHKVGDDTLRRVAALFGAAARAEDTVARVGGDEFAWILPETTGQEALAAVERARRELAAGIGALPRVTISAGICDSSFTADPTELVRFADRALYSSKHHGRDQARLYVPTADEATAHGVH